MTQTPRNNVEDITITMVNKINSFKSGLQEYEIRDLVTDTENFGKELVRKQLKTNQIRKFLDAVKRLKSTLDKSEKRDIKAINDDLFLLLPQLAYAAARQQRNPRDPGPVAPFKQVLEAAIKKVVTPTDFDKFVQLVESIIAYHKAAGGQDQ